MRVAVISDIHANLPALEATAEAIRREATGRGLVSRRPRRLRRLAERVLLVGGSPHGGLPCGQPRPRRPGHARPVGLRRRRGGCGGVEQRSARLPTPAPSSPGSARASSSTASGSSTAARATRCGSTCSPWEAAHDAILDSGTEITVVGHSHVPLAIPDGGPAEGGVAVGGTEVDLGGARWLLNPGSVGQPRDGDPRAAWMLLDLGARHASFRREPYDVARAQETIRAAGLPDALAERLAHGV